MRWIQQGLLNPFLFLSGILPVVAGIGLLIIGNNLPTYKMEEIDWNTYAANQANYCYADSIHMVTFQNNSLYDVFQNNNSCFDGNTSFVYAYTGGDVWCASESTARSIASNSAGYGYISCTYGGYNCYTLIDANNNQCGHVLYGGSEPAQQ